MVVSFLLVKIQPFFIQELTFIIILIDVRITRRRILPKKVILSKVLRPVQTKKHLLEGPHLPKETTILQNEQKDITKRS